MSHSANSEPSPADRLSSELVLHLSRCLEAAAAEGYDTPKKRAEILRLVNAVSNVRRADLARDRFLFDLRKFESRPAAASPAGAVRAPSAPSEGDDRDPMIWIRPSQRPPIGTPQYQELAQALRQFEAGLGRPIAHQEALAVAARVLSPR